MLSAVASVSGLLSPEPWQPSPSFLVADEPVSALDVSVQAQILNLLLTLQQQLNLSMLFIAHDIAVVRHVSDRIAVMYLGKIVELGEAREICVRPVHPYTEALLASIPLPMPGLETLHEMPKGDLPDPANPPTGCRFHTRCPYSQPICEEEEPALRPFTGDADHFGACHFQDELQLQGVEEMAKWAPLQRAESGGEGERQEDHVEPISASIRWNRISSNSIALQPNPAKEFPCLSRWPSTEQSTHTPQARLSPCRRILMLNWSASTSLTQSTARSWQIPTLCFATVQLVRVGAGDARRPCHRLRWRPKGLNVESLDQTAEIVAAGKHVWYDKAAGDNWTQWQQVVAAAREKEPAHSDGLHAALPRRFSPDRRMGQERPSSVTSSLSAPTCPPTFLQTAASRSTPIAGGIFYELAGHMLDQIIWILGRPTKAACFFAHR